MTSPPAFAADSPGHITGVGGIFFTSKDPKPLAAWYRDVLGLPVESWGGAALRYDAPGHPPDDLEALLRKLKAKGVRIIKQDATDSNGKFAWILDPDGNKVELWEPKQSTSTQP